MKILRVNSAGFEEGGAESGIVAIGPVLEKLGHEVRIVAGDARPDLPHFNQYTFRAPHGFLGKLAYTFNFSAYFALRKAILDFKPDIVHLHTLGSASPLILFALRGYPTVATVHGPEGYTRDLLMWCLPKSDFKKGEYEISDLRVVGKLRYFYYRYINYPIYRIGFQHVDRFVTISRYICRLMESQGVSSAYVPNGVQMLPYSPLTTESVASHQIVYAGRLEKFKGVEYLLRALPKVIKTFPNTKITIAGTGRDSDELVALVDSLGIKDSVTFPGHVSKSELYKLYKGASLVVVPSIWPEVASRSGIEAMSVGLPIVGTDVGGTGDWLINGETGYLIPPKDVDAISNAIVHAFSNPEKLIEMSAKARAKAEDYAIERHADRIIKVYESVLENRGIAIVPAQKMMRMYYVTDQLMDHGSAAYVHVSEICAGIRSLGHSVTLYAPTVANIESEGERSTVYIPASGRFLSIAYQPKLFFRLRRDIKRLRPDILYVRKSQLLFVPAIISWWYTIPLILEVNGLVEQDAKHVDPNFISKLLLRTKIFAGIEILNVRRASHFVVVAEGFRQFLTNRFRIPDHTISTIQNGVNTTLFAPQDRVEMRHDLGIPEGFTVGYIGSLHRWQGLRCIVAAAKIVSEKRPDIRFCIVGGMGADGEYLSDYVQTNNLEQNVHLVSETDYVALSRYKAAIDIGLCYPLRIRAGLTSPMKIYEYLSSGCPVVASDIPGMREEFGDMLVYAKAECAESLSSEIITLANDEQKRITFGLQGRAYIEAGHSWQVVATKIVAICTTILDASSTLL